MKKAVKIIPRSYYKLIVALIILLCLGANESMCAEDNTTENVPKKKSYIIAGAGALICPALGHSYIGGKNISRGILYTGIEIASGFFAVIVGMSSAVGESGDATPFKYYSSLFIATHVISFADAFVSTYKYNKSHTNVTILPGKSSLKLTITKTF